MTTGREQAIKDKAIEGAAAEAIQRYGAAIKEHFVAYVGADRETGKTLTKGLKTISGYKSDDSSKTGFSAEVKAAARATSEAIINGDSSTKTVRTDDMTRQSAGNGRQIGGVNEQLYDNAQVDAFGRYIPGTGVQLKFRGKNGAACADLLLKKEFDKYRENDVPIEIPNDYFEDAQKRLEEKADSLKKQINDAAQKGDIEGKQELERQLKVVKSTKLKKSNLTMEEAMEAARTPEISTLKEVVGIANRAGLEQMKVGAIFSGSISLIKNAVSCAKGDIDPLEAGKNIAIDTGKGAAMSYATAFSGSVIKGAMQNSSSTYIRSVSNTNLAGILVSTSVDVGRAITKYIKGEYTGAECLEAMGEKGFGSLGAAMYSTIAMASVSAVKSVAIKTIVGMAGSSLGYMAAVAVYEELSSSLKEYEIAKADRAVIEAECNEAIKLIQQYRLEMKEIVEKYLTEHLEVFSSGFEAMDLAIIENDNSGFLRGNAEIQSFLGHDVQFTTQEEFDALMDSDESFKL